MLCGLCCYRVFRQYEYPDNEIRKQSDKESVLLCFLFQLISAAVVPILKLNDRSERLEGDISVDIQNSIFNTYLQKCYGEMDPRVIPLVVIVKYWAQVSRITGAHDHKLSGQ